MEDQYNSNKKQIWYSTENKRITKFSNCDYLLKTHRHWLVFHGFISLVVMAINGFSIVHILKVLFLLAGPVWTDMWSCWIFYLKAIYCLFLIKTANGFYWFLKCAILDKPFVLIRSYLCLSILGLHYMLSQRIFVGGGEISRSIINYLASPNILNVDSNAQRGRLKTSLSVFLLAKQWKAPPPSQQPSSQKSDLHKKM